MLVITNSLLRISMYENWKNSSQISLWCHPLKHFSVPISHARSMASATGLTHIILKCLALNLHFMMSGKSPVGIAFGKWFLLWTSNNDRPHRRDCVPLHSGYRDSPRDLPSAGSQKCPWWSCSRHRGKAWQKHVWMQSDSSLAECN